MAKDVPATLDDLVRHVKTTNRLLAAQLRARLSQMELIALLQESDLNAREIGEVVGTTAATVAVTLQRVRGKKKR